MGYFFWVGSLRRGGKDSPEKHGAGSGLVKTDELNFNFLTDFFAGMVNNDHSAVTEISDALVWITAGGDDFNFSMFAGKILVA